MTERHTLLLRILIVGLAYYGGAWLGVTQTITPEGIAIIWPPNAILLAAFLLLPYRHWSAIAVAAVAAEVAADVPAFPLWAAFAFGLVNLFETAFAAWLIRRSVSSRFDFDSLKSGGYFLLFGPLLASSLAALLGAAVYLLLGRSDSSYLVLWRLWWFGDGLGLILLTPLIVVLWRWLEQGWRQPRWASVSELGLLWLLVWLVAGQAFPMGEHAELGFHLTPVVLLPFAALAAVRFGVRGAAATVVVIAMLAIAFMVRGIHPYTDVAPRFAVWLMQEYLAVVAVLSIGLALLLHEIRSQRDELESRVTERTEALSRSNAALEEANKRLNNLASTDYLTGIANRRHFLDTARREMERQAAGSESVALVMLDLDHFKAINDRYGHDGGDEVLRSVVHTVKETIRPLDLFGRIGGEEFLVMLPATTGDEAMRIAERIRQHIESLRLNHEGHDIGITASLGVVLWNGTDSLERLVTRADRALYRAKSQGRNRVASADEGLPAQGAS